MKILFLDDDENRHSHAMRVLAGCDVTYVRTVSQALTALAKDRFDVAMLDHDLGGEHYTPSNELSGHAVALAIAQGVVTRPGYVVVHSFNAPGAVQMVRTLAGADVPAVWAPFGPIAFQIAQAEALEVR